MTVAAIEGLVLPARAQMAERGGVRSAEIADVDVVADAGSVGGRIVGAEDIEAWPHPERCLDRDLDKVRGAEGRLPGAQLWIGAGDVEIAQDHVVQVIG